MYSLTPISICMYYTVLLSMHILNMFEYAYLNSVSPVDSDCRFLLSNTNMHTSSSFGIYGWCTSKLIDYLCTRSSVQCMHTVHLREFFWKGLLLGLLVVLCASIDFSVLNDSALPSSTVRTDTFSHIICCIRIVKICVCADTCGAGMCRVPWGIHCCWVSSVSYRNKCAYYAYQIPFMHAHRIKLVERYWPGGRWYTRCY